MRRSLQFAVMDNCDLTGASLVKTDLEWSDLMGGTFIGAETERERERERETKCVDMQVRTSRRRSCWSVTCARPDASARRRLRKARFSLFFCDFQEENAEIAPFFVQFNEKLRETPTRGGDSEGWVRFSPLFL